MYYLFCCICGVYSFVCGYVEEIGGYYVVVQLVLFDDVDLVELIDVLVCYVDGCYDNWYYVLVEIWYF